MIAGTALFGDKRTYRFLIHLCSFILFTTLSEVVALMRFRYGKSGRNSGCRSYQGFERKRRKIRPAQAPGVVATLGAVGPRCQNAAASARSTAH